jgi:hypothetical protein
LLVTEMVTEKVPDTVGVPETTPAVEQARAAGKPEHVHVVGPEAPVAVSESL